MHAPLNLHEYESLARQQLPPMVYDYYAGGADDQVTLRANRTAFDTVRLQPRVMVDVSHRQTGTTLWGKAWRAPIIVAPMGFQCLAHPEGELATRRAAARVGIPFCASTMSNYRLEEIVSVDATPVLFQLYVYRDRGVTRSLVERAQAAGCLALQVTADLPVLGRREADIRNCFRLTPGLRIGNLDEAGLGQLPTDAALDSRIALYTASMLDASLNWRDIEWLRSFTTMPILIKGILRSDDAALAMLHGASGVVVSNHGGRQLDTAVATFDVLESIAEVVRSAGGVTLMDGGIRRGTDILKALARGADAVQVGRPILWGLGVDGQAGVERVLQLLMTEFDQALALCGMNSPRDLPPNLLRNVLHIAGQPDSGLE